VAIEAWLPKLPINSRGVISEQLPPMNWPSISLRGCLRSAGLGCGGEPSSDSRAIAAKARLKVSNVIDLPVRSYVGPFQVASPINSTKMVIHSL